MALWNGVFQRDFHERSVGELAADKTADHAGDAGPDSGEIDQQIHVGDVDGVLNADLVVLKVTVDVLPRHIVFIEEHQGCGGENVVCWDASGAQVAEVIFRRDEGVLDFFEKVKAGIFQGIRFSDQSDIDSAVVKEL